LPVLTSDQTFWRHLRERGVGWDLPLADPQGFREVIEMYSRASAEECLKIRRKAVHYAEQVSSNEDVIAQNLRLFTQAARPEGVAEGRDE
jgi:hypothetical protein